MSKIFLSHSSRQKSLVEKVYEKLGSDRAVYDTFTFETGMDTLEEILSNLKKTDIFIFFISHEALESKWVRSELNEAKRLLHLDYIKQFIPIIVDDTKHSDPRIPDWIRKKNLKQLKEPFLIIKKIEQAVREVILDNRPMQRAKEEAFVGRNHLMEEFEGQILTTDGIRPVSFVASGVEGVGRRTFIRKALAKIKLIPDDYDPISIYLDAKESIEDLIIKLEELNGTISDEVLTFLKQSDFTRKIDQAVKILEKIIQNNEKLFIIDSGCIIRPNKHISSWFLQIVDDVRLNNSFSVILISRFRPNPSFIAKHKRIKTIHIDPLSPKDREKLFVQYKDILSITLSKESTDIILSCLNGIPSQVYYAVDLVRKSTSEYVLKNLQEIIDYGDAKVFYLIEEIQEDSRKLDILVLISKIDFISFDLLYKVIGRTPENERIIEEFFIMGIYDTFGGFSEHIRVNYSISDYIRRSKFTISSRYSAKLKSQMQQFLSDSMVNSDVSELLQNVKSALIAGIKVPDRYILPSFVLKSIVELYCHRKFSQVIKLADSVLENKLRMDYDMEREIKYWLCLALAREKLDRFETEVKSIDGSDYDFLMGFYYRRRREYDKALRYLEQALAKSPSFNRAKRELVNVLLSMGQYSTALHTAKENYNISKTNAFHIQAYFMCLIRKRNLLLVDIQTIKRLLDDINKTNEPKADVFYVTMKGEYQYYIKGERRKAIGELEESLKKSQYKYYPYRALYDIYMNEGRYSDADELKRNYDSDYHSMEELEIFPTVS